MTRVYFVRHAQPDHGWEDDRTRPLTDEGREDSGKVLEVLKDKNINFFYCSPYKRSMDTIGESAAYYGMDIITDERLRERESGTNGNHHGMFQKRWENHDFHEEGGESIAMVQERNVEALKEILQKNAGKNLVVGTHGTALSSILNYFDAAYDCDSFLRILDWMPYIIELDFEEELCTDKTEHLYIEKDFKGK
ncbi:histidine phosphatase family protein [Lacrimispora indolis]|uniref:histidine phosphatase family protein n=1 Tax=Lacrimispora indolis TaxID=69825 RepID=UPI0003F541E3|nr:histidine phosphatase family protein [[Clostridium] methoxybenzovorans]